MPYANPQDPRRKKAALKWYYGNRDHALKKKAEWRAKNIEMVREKGREYARMIRVRCPEKKRASAKKSYAKNREYYRDKYKRNRDRLRVLNHAARKANWPRFLARAAARRARLRLVTVGDLTEISKVYARCAVLRKWFDVCVDHIVPIAKGGTHEPSNLQIIYSLENCEKRDRMDYKPRVIFA
jgi:hypothetical protein